MVGVAFVYQALLIILEYRLLQRFIKFNLGASFNDNVTDEDVKVETLRVQNMVKNGKQKQCLI